MMQSASKVFFSVIFFHCDLTHFSLGALNQLQNSEVSRNTIVPSRVS